MFRGRSDPAPAELSSGHPTVMPVHTSPIHHRCSRLACITATFVAFLMGLGVGVTLPLVMAKGVFEGQDEPSSASHIQLKESLGATSVATSTSLTQLEKEITSTPVHSWMSSTPSPSPLNLVNFQVEDSDIREFKPASNVQPVENTNKELLADNVYWGGAVEAELPKGFTDEEVDSWRKFVRQNAIVRLQEGCGRMQNRLLTFQNGTQSCCRYRQNFDQIQGEIYSFYLSRLLGILNVPPSSLGVVRAGTWQWIGVGSQLALAQWGEERPVVLTQFVPGLGPAFIPVHFRSSSKRFHPLDVENHNPRDMQGLTELAQWTDLIIFDYLTANLDRVVNNLYNMQWNPTMMEAPTHNLARHRASGLLVFLDNESGLLHGYRLLDKYETYHASLLESICVFRKGTVDRLRKLLNRGDVGEKLLRMFRNHDPDLQDYLPPLPDRSIKLLNERLRSVHKQVLKCEKLYTNT